MLNKLVSISSVKIGDVRQATDVEASLLLHMGGTLTITK